MNITASMLANLDPTRSYYLSNTTGEIKEAGFWQRFKCWTGWGDGREKVQRLADAIKTALLADAGIEGEAKLSEELDGLNKNASLSGASLRAIASRFKADHAAAIATSDANRLAEQVADRQVQTWAANGDVLPDEESLGYVKRLALYAAQSVTEKAITFDDPRKLEHKIRNRMSSLLGLLNCAEVMKRSEVGYPKAEKCTDAAGRVRHVNPPRFRFDELHFRAILGIMSTKDGLATFMPFAKSIVKTFTEEELQKRKDVILKLPLEGPGKAGSGLEFAGQLAKSAEIYNANILKGISAGANDRPPAAFVQAEDEIVAEVRARFGNAIDPSVSIRSLMTFKEHAQAVSPLVERANAEGRTVGADEVKDAIREKCMRAGAARVVRRAFEEVAAEIGYKKKNAAPAASFARLNPAVLDEIAACETPEAAREAAMKHKDRIAGILRMGEAADKVFAELPAMAAAMVAEKSGMPLELVTARLNGFRLKNKADGVVNDIVSGKVEGADKPGFDMKTAFQGVLDDYVNGYLAFMKEVDGIEGISEDLKGKWKVFVLASYKPAAMQPAKIYDLIVKGRIDGKKLEEALDAPDAAQTAEKMCACASELDKIFIEVFGAEEWMDMGNDEREPVLKMALMGVMERNPGIAAKFLARSEELFGGGRENAEFNREEFAAKGDGRKIVENLYSLLLGEDAIKAEGR